MNKDIDWNKPQYFMDNDCNVVLSTGEHMAQYFMGTMISSRYMDSSKFVKSHFKLIEGTVKIKISN